MSLATPSTRVVNEKQPSRPPYYCFHHVFRVVCLNRSESVAILSLHLLPLHLGTNLWLSILRMILMCKCVRVGVVNMRKGCM